MKNQNFIQDNCENFKVISQLIFEDLSKNDQAETKTRRYGPKIITTYTVDNEFYCEIKIRAGADHHKCDCDVYFETTGKNKTKLTYYSFQNLSKNFYFVVNFFEVAIKTYNDQKHTLQL